MTTALTTRVNTDATYAPSVASGPLTSAQIDNNFISLATNKVETSLLDTTATNNTVVKRTSSGGIAATALTLSTTPLDPTSGGTGQSAYTTGDLLYASATNTLSKLAKGADGQVLTLASGVPTWQTASATAKAIAFSLVFGG